MTNEKTRSFSCPTWTDFPDIELYMDQVISVLDRALSPYSQEEKCITSTMINNYVKSGVLPPPKNKKYNRTHLAILMIVCITKPVMEISAISEIIHRGIEADQMENVLNGLASKFENELASAAQTASETAKNSSHEEILSLIAIENVMKANAARTIAMHAYNAIKTDEPEDTAKTEKAEKKAEKKKAKKEAEHQETAEKSEENA